MVCMKLDRIALAPRRAFFPVADYDLAATLNSGQAFRWVSVDRGWEGVLDARWVRLTQGSSGITAETAQDCLDWDWLTHYLQLDVDLEAVLAEFPDDEPMRQAVQACRGLRLLRQDPWECLASFILSSTKQIVQIRQIVAQLCACFGDPLPSLPGRQPAFSFPGPERLAKASETALRGCKMGFRAPYLLQTALAVAQGQPRLASLAESGVEAAREQLIQLPGVGRKIADCVLLFAFGYPEAFPVDVWVTKALRELYFPARRVRAKRLQRFAQTHFGPHAGYAQQYLFHYMRTRPGQAGRSKSKSKIKDQEQAGNSKSAPMATAGTCS